MLNDIRDLALKMGFCRTLVYNKDSPLCSKAAESLTNSPNISRILIQLRFMIASLTRLLRCVYRGAVSAMLAMRQATLD